MIETTYAYYHNTYKGELDEDTFNKFNKKAGYKIDNITNGAYKSVSAASASETMKTDVREMTCEVVDRLAALSGATGDEMDVEASFGNLKSYKVGSVSKTYSGNAEKKASLASTTDGSIRDIVIEYCGKYGWGCRWV